MNTTPVKETLEKKVKRTRWLLIVSTILSVICAAALLCTNMVFKEHVTLYILAIGNFFQGTALYNSYQKRKQELRALD